MRAEMERARTPSSNCAMWSATSGLLMCGPGWKPSQYRKRLEGGGCRCEAEEGQAYTNGTSTGSACCRVRRTLKVE